MGGKGTKGCNGRSGGTGVPGGTGTILFVPSCLRGRLLLVFSRLAAPALSASAQVGFDQAIKDLASPDANTRLRTVQILKDGAYPEAAVPLAALVTDRQDTVQLEAIAAELNIFLANEVATRKGGALVIEKRHAMTAEAAFSSGPLALAFKPVPMEVLNALRAAARDDHPRVALEALYAFGALAYEPGGPGSVVRRDLVHAGAPDLSARFGVRDAAQRSGAARVIGRVFEKRVADDSIDASLGDALITALNDKDRAVKAAAMQALGAVRYERAVQALTELFTFYGKGEPAEAALVRARLHDQAKRYLVEIAPGRATLFARHVQDPDSRIRLEMADVFMPAGDPRALPLVEPLARDNDPVVAHAAQRAVRRLRSASPHPAS